MGLSILHFIIAKSTEVWFGTNKSYKKTVFTHETIVEGVIIDVISKIIKRTKVRSTNEIKLIMIPWFSRKLNSYARDLDIIIFLLFCHFKSYLRFLINDRFKMTVKSNKSVFTIFFNQFAIIISVRPEKEHKLIKYKTIICIL